MFITAIIAAFFLILYSVMYLHDLVPRKYVIELFNLGLQDVLIAASITFLLVYYNVI